jgi:enoyl-CoA hydratase
MPEDIVLLERDGPVALITLNRPDKHNAVNREMQNALGAIVQDLEADESCLVMVPRAPATRRSAPARTWVK